MIISVINSLTRAMKILDDIPRNIEKERTNTLSTINNLFEDVQDQFSKEEDQDTLQKITALKKEVLGKVENFCDTACKSVKEDVRIVEE